MQERRAGKGRRRTDQRSAKLRAVRLMAVLGIYALYAAMFLVAWNAIAC